MKELRPYYDPDTFDGDYLVIYRPGTGVLYENGKTISETLSSNAYSNNNTHSNIFGNNLIRNLYHDLELHDLFDLNNFKDIFKNILNSLFKNYLKICISQPFEVVRLLLQIGYFHTSQFNDSRLSPFERQQKKLNQTHKDKNDLSIDSNNNLNNSIYANSDREDEMDYFFSNTTNPYHNDDSNYDLKPKNKNHLQPLSLNTIDIMSSILSFEGTRGLWRATNSTFLYNTLFTFLEAWLSGFLSPFLNIPDPFFIDATQSPSPLNTFLLSLFVSVSTSFILSPLDLIKTKFIITSINNSNRNFKNIISYQFSSIISSSSNSEDSFKILNLIKLVKFFLPPLTLVLPIFLNSFTSNFLKKFTPYFLFIKFGIDNYNSPILFEMLNLLSEIVELFIKLPFETLLRRSQVSYLINYKGEDQKKLEENSLKVDENTMIVKFAGYNGIFKTLFDIYYLRDNENNGFDGLCRGWRIGLLKIFAGWGFRMSNNPELSFVEEKF
ncbi:mitofusin complex protein UGO1 [Ascoidea rubescens DSM 1968]|uniref:Mitochondrial carrier n=1 Tax=Ascoidea rubescens DSM 1968 TaxID=1344418 RepID=A0A1D2VKL2_9ASCO|nr:mitochondrial carrier [Ascoidea rubescens DSM 1968]ODV62077.1 mitochondrial carrier [Ascoidea rubescens DSM 1968]